MRPRAALDQHPAARTRHRQEVGPRCGAIQNQRTVALVGEDGRVADRALAELLDVRGEPSWGELPSVVLEQADHLAVDKVEGEAVEVADVGDQRTWGGLDARILE